MTRNTWSLRASVPVVLQTTHSLGSLRKFRQSWKSVRRGVRRGGVANANMRAGMSQRAVP
jgi:hypothetical protein